MDFIQQIDEFVAYSADAKTLKKEIEDYKKNEAYALVEGDLSYNRGDYSLEKQYNKSVSYNRQKARELEAGLENLNKLLKESKNNVIKMTENLSYNDIHFATERVKSNVERLKNYVNGIQEKLKIAQSNGDNAYNSGDYTAEKIYNQEYKQCLGDIEKLSPLIESYEEAFTYLSSKEMTMKETEQGLGR